MSDERERERRAWLQRRKLHWHETLICDVELHKGAGALAFAGLVLHRYHVVLGYAEVSVGYASVKLGIPLPTVHRGRRLLLERHWIVPWQASVLPKRRRPDAAKRYTLGGGPDDLLWDECQGVTGDTLVTDDIPQ